jgi:hypothetical protein
MANKSDKTEAPEVFEMPSKLMPNHVLLNPEDAVSRHRWAVADDTPLGVAYAKGRLQTGRRGYTDRDRYEAGLVYRGIWDTVHGSGCGGFNPNRVSGGTGNSRDGERLCDARANLARIHEYLSTDNAYLVKCFIGEGSTASSAVRHRMNGFEKAVWIAISSALDDLADAVVRFGLSNAVSDKAA